MKLCWKTRLHVIFGTFFGTTRWITFERKKISKIANKVLEKRQRRGSVPNFKTRALAVWKLKGKENGGRAHTSLYTGICHPASHSSDTAGWQAKMASIELWIQWCNAHGPHCENEHRETASFRYNFVQKTNATVQLWWHFIPTSPLNSFTRFSPEGPFKKEL